MLKFQPDAGKVMLGPARMLIFRVHALQVLRGLMHEQLGAELNCYLHGSATASG